jgi:hypothetical protein
MGVFSNIWKGVKKTFKKIGKGVKGAFKKFGKFMNKAGILGTVAIGILTGGMGFGAMLGNFGATLAGSGSALLRGAGWVIGKAAQFGNMVSSGFKTLTSGVTEFFGQAGKYIGGKLGMPGMENIGMGEAWGNYSKALTENFSNFTSDVSSFASNSAFDVRNVAVDASPSKSILDSTPEDYQQNAEILANPVEEAVKDPKPSLLARGAEMTVENVGKSVTEVPGAVVKQGLMQAVQGTPDYEEPLSMSYAPQVQFANVAGAAQAAMTPLTDDQQFAQFNVNYDTGLDGFYGPSRLYSERLKAFSV